MREKAGSVAGPTRTAERDEREGVAAARPRPESGPEADTGGPSPAGRVRRRLPGRRTALILAVLLTALGGFGTWAVYGSPWLRVEHVSVSGTRVLTEHRVRAAADIPLGTPMGSLDKAAAEHRVRAELSRVRTVSVVRAWPHGVGLKITERKPVLLQERAGKYVEVDSGGVRFATAGKPAKGVPLLLMDPRLPAADRPFSTARLRRAAADVVTALPASVRRDTRTVRVRSYDAVTVELTGGRTVLWGNGERGPAKARALRAVMKAAGDARHFDVSVPSAPAGSGS